MQQERGMVICIFSNSKFYFKIINLKQTHKKVIFMYFDLLFRGFFITICFFTLKTIQVFITFFIN